MIYIFGAVVALIWIAVLFGSLLLLIKVADQDGLFTNPLYDIAFGLAGLIICIASALWFLTQEDDQPCVRYETTMQYNAATKTTMPVRYCAQYGEWLK